MNSFWQNQVKACSQALHALVFARDRNTYNVDLLPRAGEAR